MHWMWWKMYADDRIKAEDLHTNGAAAPCHL